MERIGDQVRRELGRFGPAAGMADLVAAWPETVGAGVARNAWPARLSRDGTLHVATSSAVWAHELRLLEGEVLGRLRAALGESAPPRLRFAVGRLPEAAAELADEPSARRPPEPTAEQRAEAVRIAARVRDSELREAVARAAAASLARSAARRAL
jgi:hypothetical protein